MSLKYIAKKESGANVDMQQESTNIIRIRIWYRMLIIRTRIQKDLNPFTRIRTRIWSDICIVFIPIVLHNRKGTRYVFRPCLDPIFLDFTTVAFSFVFGNYYPIMD